MKDKKVITPVSESMVGDDVTTWALPDGAIARLGRGCLPDIAFSPDERYLAVGTWVGLWCMTWKRYLLLHSGKRNEVWLDVSPSHLMENGLLQAIQTMSLKFWTYKMEGA